jgi:hypothetical protein
MNKLLMIIIYFILLINLFTAKIINFNNKQNNILNIKNNVSNLDKKHDILNVKDKKHDFPNYKIKYYNLKKYNDLEIIIKIIFGIININFINDIGKNIRHNGWFLVDCILSVFDFIVIPLNIIFMSIITNIIRCLKNNKFNEYIINDNNISIFDEMTSINNNQNLKSNIVTILSVLSILPMLCIDRKKHNIDNNNNK